MERKIVLGEKAFRALCRGGEVTVVEAGKPTIKMILSDIGFGPMSDAVDDAIAGIETYKGEVVSAEGDT